MNQEEEFKTVNVTILKGTAGNTEWWTTEDWEQHRKNVEEWKADGTYLQPVDMSISFNPMPLFDDPVPPSGTMTGRMVFIDQSQYNKT